MSLDRTITALVPNWPPLSPPERADLIKACVTFVRAQLRLAPFHIRFGFRVLFIAFSIYALFSVGPFPGLGARARALTAFSALRLPLASGLERLLRASSMLAYFDHPLVLKALNEPAPAERQMAFRALRSRLMEASP